MQFPSTIDQLLMFAIKQSTYGKTLTHLLYLTGLRRTTLIRRLNKLEKLGLIASVNACADTVYYAQQLSDAPVRPDYAAWISRFAANNASRVHDDMTERIYCTCRDVLMVALTLGSRDEARVSQHAAVPLPFAGLVLGVADREGFWFLEVTLSVESVIRSEEPESQAIYEAAQDLAETFWNVVWNENLELAFAEMLVGRLCHTSINYGSDQTASPNWKM